MAASLPPWLGINVARPSLWSDSKHACPPNQSQHRPHASATFEHIHTVFVQSGGWEQAAFRARCTHACHGRLALPPAQAHHAVTFCTWLRLIARSHHLLTRDPTADTEVGLAENPTAAKDTIDHVQRAVEQFGATNRWDRKELSMRVWLSVDPSGWRDSPGHL